MDWEKVADRCLALLAEPTGNAENGWTNECLREQLRRKFGVALEEQELAEMIGDVIRQGQFGTATRDKWGRRVRAPRVISFFDTKDGRYLQIRRESEGGEAWTTISPADGRRMLQHLTTLHEEQQQQRS